MDLGLPASPLLAAFTASGAFLAALSYITSNHVHDDDIQRVKKWLKGEYKNSWADHFCDMFDSIYGKRHLSVRCFFASAITSILIVAILYVIFGAFLGIIGEHSRSLNSISIWQALFLGILLNTVPDFLSLYETRFLLQILRKTNRIWLQILILFVDLFITGFIIYAAINIYQKVNGNSYLSIIQMIGAFDIFSIFFYSTFFTSVWAWTYCLSTWIMRLFSETSLKDKLPIDKKPLQQINFLSSIILFAVILSFLSLNNFKNTDGITIVDDFFCSVDKTVCRNVAGMAKDPDSQFGYLFRECKKKNDPFYCYYSAYYKYGDFMKNIDLKKTTEACDKNKTNSCNILALYYALGGTVSKSEDGTTWKTHKADQELAEKMARKSCDNNDIFGCTLLQSFFRQAYKSAQLHAISKDRILKRYEQYEQISRELCKKNPIGFCNELGKMLILETSPYSNREKILDVVDEAMTIWEDACQHKKDHNSCATLGGVYKEGATTSGHEVSFKKVQDFIVHTKDKVLVEKDLKKSLHYYQMACQGDLFYCGLLGDFYMGRDNIQKDYAQAKKYYSRGCRKGYNQACMKLARLYETDDWAKRNYKKSAKIYTEFCHDDAMFPDSCSQLGALYEHGRGVEKDAEMAMNLYKTGCEQESMSACNNIGRLYQYGVGLEQDLHKAMAKYTFACKKGYAEACGNAGYMFEKGLGVKQNYMQAKNLYEYACDKQDLGSCESLGNLYENGLGVKQDKAKAYEYFQKSSSGM